MIEEFASYTKDETGVELLSGKTDLNSINYKLAWSSSIYAKLMPAEECVAIKLKGRKNVAWAAKANN